MQFIYKIGRYPRSERDSLAKQNLTTTVCASELFATGGRSQSISGSILEKGRTKEYSVTAFSLKIAKENVKKSYIVRHHMIPATKHY